MNRDEMVQYVEEKRVWGSDIVYDSKGNKESGSYISSAAAELASNLYKGTHRFKDVKKGVTEIWFFGQHITIGLDV